MAKEFTDANFKSEVLDSDKLSIVDFWAEWCGPCRMMAPEMDAFAAKHLGRVFVAKVDTDRNQATAGQFGIRSIPTVIKFDGGAKVAEQAGAMRLPQIEAFAGVG